MKKRLEYCEIVQNEYRQEQLDLLKTKEAKQQKLRKMLKQKLH